MPDIFPQDKPDLEYVKLIKSEKFFIVKRCLHHLQQKKHIVFLYYKIFDDEYACLLCSECSKLAIFNKDIIKKISFNSNDDQLAELSKYSISKVSEIEID